MVHDTRQLWTSVRGQGRAIAWLALAYFAAARLALVLALPPGYATAVWPAAGIALAAVLVRGFGVWPGILLGATASNVLSALLDGGIDSLLPSVGLGVGMGFGATIQALVAAFLVQRYVGYPATLAKERDGLQLLLLGGMLACCVSATVGVAVLFLNGLVGDGDLGYSWVTWWTGDVLGTITCAPLALMFIGEPQHGWRRLRVPVGLPIAGSLVLTVFAYLLARTSEMGNLRSEFDHRAEDVIEFVASGVQQMEDDLRDVAALFDSSKTVDADAFRTFAQRVLGRRAGAFVLEWAPRVLDADRTAVSAAVGEPIWQRNGAGDKQPAAGRADYFPVEFVEPMVGNEAARGFDLGSEPARRAAIDAALASGRTVVTRSIHLVQDPTRGKSLLAVLPVYTRPAAARTADQVRGIAIVVVRLRDMMAPLASSLDASQLAVRVRDVTDAENELFALGAGPDDATSEFSAVSPVDAAGRDWVVDVAATRAFLAARRPLQAWAILAGGMLFCGMAGIVLLAAAGRTATVAREVKLRTADLEQSNARLAASIEEHRMAQAALLRIRRELEAAETRSRLGSWELDPVTRTGNWSPNMFRLFGRDPAAGVPPLDDFLEQYVHPDDRRQIEDVHAFVFRSGESAEFELRLLPRDGRTAHLHVVVGISSDDGGRRLVGSVLDITARKEIEARLRANVREKEVMVQEIHHRVKNNLQIVISLLNMQARTVDSATAAILRDSQERIHAMARIHEALYRSRDLASLDLPQHVTDLCWHLVAAHELGRDRIQLQLDVEPICITLEQAVPLSLLMNELIANACKHAFPNGRKGTIRVALGHVTPTEYRLEVADDGQGLPPGGPKRTGIGTRLISSLAQQLDGDLRIDGTAGTRTTIVFPATTAASANKVESTCPQPKS